MMKHSPRPWTANIASHMDDSPSHEILDAEFNCLAYLPAQDEDGRANFNRAAANAHLIAAAPDLLEALKAAHPFIADDKTRAHVGSVIVKATEA